MDKIKENIIKKHLGFQGSTNDKWWLQASIDYYRKSGMPSGSLYEAIEKAMEAYKSQSSSELKTIIKEMEDKRDALFKESSDCFYRNPHRSDRYDDMGKLLDEFVLPKLKSLSPSSGMKWTDELVFKFAQIILSQYKCGNTNIVQPTLLKETLEVFKQSESPVSEDGWKDKLCEFFIWFRNNGELHIGKSVEGLVDEYLKTKM